LDTWKDGRPGLNGDAADARQAGVAGIRRLRLVDDGEVGGVEFSDQRRLDLADQGVDDQAADGSQAGGASDRDGRRDFRLPVLADPGGVQRPCLPEGQVM